MCDEFSHHCWVPAAITAQRTTKGMKRPHKNVDNPRPERPRGILEWLSPVYPGVLHCVDKLTTKGMNDA